MKSLFSVLSLLESRRFFVIRTMSCCALCLFTSSGVILPASAFLHNSVTTDPARFYASVRSKKQHPTIIPFPCGNTPQPLILPHRSVTKLKLLNLDQVTENLDKWVFGAIDKELDKKSAGGTTNQGTKEPDDPRQEFIQMTRLATITTSKPLTEFLTQHDDNKEDGSDEEDDPPLPKQLNDVDVAHASLTSFLNGWAFLLSTDQSSSRLTTPITAGSFTPTKVVTVNDDDDEINNNKNEKNNVVDKNASSSPSSLGTNTTSSTVLQSSSLKIMFRPPKRYLSYNEQKNMEKGVMPDRKGAKLDAWSPGGVEVLVETVFHNEQQDNPARGRNKNNANTNVIELRLIAKRCGIDGDTIIKVNSERTIVRRLKDAIRIWKNVRQHR